MSVTEYLTDHNGNKVAFFYYIDSERYRTCPQKVYDKLALLSIDDLELTCMEYHN